MSYVLSFKAAKCTLGNSSVKAVLRCLCDYANDDGSNCRPSTETIAFETECDRRTVFKAVSFLASNGWIKVFSKGRGARNFYAINVDKIEAVYQQSKGIVEQVKFESGDKNVTTSGSDNATSDKNDTSDKNAPRVVSILSESGDKNVTQLSQTQSIQSDKPIESAPNFSLTSPENQTISKPETVEKETKRPKKQKVPCPYNEDDPIPEEFLKIAQKHNIQDPQQLFSKMVAYCKANGKQYADYKAAFTTWCLNESKWQQQKPPNQTSKSFAYEPPGGFTDEFYMKGCKFDKNGNLIL